MTETINKCAKKLDLQVQLPLLKEKKPAECKPRDTPFDQRKLENWVR
jgi:hypothetical protein